VAPSDRFPTIGPLPPSTRIMYRDDDIDWTLLTRYLAGEASPEDREAVERWVAADAARADEVAELRRWLEGAAALPSASRVDAMWRALSRRMHAADPMREAGAKAAPVSRRSAPVLLLAPRVARRHTAWRFAVGAAAASLMLLGGTFLWRARGGPGQVALTESPSREFSTARAQRATIRLVDGTRVELGFASTLHVRPFESGRRELYLEGEAVFDVVHDASRPFIVHAANAVTEDLGTTFGVRAYPGEDAVRVVVVSGRVAIRPKDPAPRGAGESAVLGPGQLGHLDASGRLEVTSGVDTTEYIAWLTGRLAFHNAKLEDVTAELQRRFDVTIRIPDSRAGARRVTVDMPAKNLADVLDAVTVPLDLHYRREGGVIVIEK
jgi:transmembrane sensor